MPFPYSKPPPLRIVRRDPAWCWKTGKMRYGSKVEAIMTLREVRNKEAHGQNIRHEGRAYHCDYCRGWHLTSKPQ